MGVFPVQVWWWLALHVLAPAPRQGRSPLYMPQALAGVAHQGWAIPPLEQLTVSPLCRRRCGTL